VLAAVIAVGGLAAVSIDVSLCGLLLLWHGVSALCGVVSLGSCSCRWLSSVLLREGMLRTR